MADQPKKSRRSWTTDQKIAFVEMRHTPTAGGKIKSVNRFCKEYNIPIKTFYPWQIFYEKVINNTDLPKIRKTIESKSRNPDLITEVWLYACCHRS
jgi:transposase-like protein